MKTRKWCLPSVDITPSNAKPGSTWPNARSPRNDARPLIAFHLRRLLPLASAQARTPREHVWPPAASVCGTGATTSSRVFFPTSGPARRDRLMPASSALVKVGRWCGPVTAGSVPAYHQRPTRARRAADRRHAGHSHRAQRVVERLARHLSIWAWMPARRGFMFSAGVAVADRLVRAREFPRVVDQRLRRVLCIRRVLSLSVLVIAARIELRSSRDLWPLASEPSGVAAVRIARIARFRTDAPGGAPPALITRHRRRAGPLVTRCWSLSRFDARPSRRSLPYPPILMQPQCSPAADRPARSAPRAPQRRTRLRG